MIEEFGSLNFIFFPFFFFPLYVLGNEKHEEKKEKGGFGECGGAGGIWKGYSVLQFVSMTLYFCSFYSVMMQ